MGVLKSNRSLVELRLSSITFNCEMILDLAEFVTNNFDLKSLNLSWSEIPTDDMLKFLERIKHINHLQHLDISTIPIGGPNSIELMN